MNWNISKEITVHEPALIRYLYRNYNKKKKKKQKKRNSSRHPRGDLMCNWNTPPLIEED